MKMLLTFFFCCLLLFNTSCTYKAKVDCKNAWYYDVFFLVPHGSDLPDTTIQVSYYKIGTNFTELIDTLSQQIGTSLTKSDWTDYDLKSYYTTIPLDTYDWKFVLLPSQKTYLLKDFTYYQRSEKQDNQDTHDCWNDYSFIVNDSLYTPVGNKAAPINGASTAFLHIMY